LDPSWIGRSLPAEARRAQIRGIDASPPTTVLLADMPRLLREIIATIVDGEADLEVVGQVESADQLVRLGPRDVPDIVIAGESPSVGAVAAELLGRFPRLRVLEVTGDGRSANIYELRPAREYVAQIGAESLLDAVRGGRA
jgi:DNA-binding NarL/FixJ family response regulator